MYQASAAFHDAAMADAQARLLMRFADGTFLTGEDVTDIEITYPLFQSTRPLRGATAKMHKYYCADL